MWTVEPLALTFEERAELERRLRAQTATHRDRQRAEVVLLAADGVPGTVIANAVGLSQQSVCKWRILAADDVQTASGAGQAGPAVAARVRIRRPRDGVVDRRVGCAPRRVRLTHRTGPTNAQLHRTAQHGRLVGSVVFFGVVIFGVVGFVVVVGSAEWLAVCEVGWSASAGGLDVVGLEPEEGCVAARWRSGLGIVGGGGDASRRGSVGWGW